MYLSIKLNFKSLNNHRPLKLFATSLYPFQEPIELDKKINVWLKFTKMPQLLKAQLLEIVEIWNSNKELSQSYACEEVRQIVKMRFPDNKYRLRILKEIQ